MKTRQRSKGVLVAVSGGADSTALALLATRADGLAGANGGAAAGPVVLAHVRHGFRRAAAAEELAQLQELSRRLGVPLHVVDLAPPPGWRPGDKIPEAFAREQRYRALAALAAQLGLATIATGHHARDRRETQLLQLLRGGGLRALAGIAELRPLPATGSATDSAPDQAAPWLWRPLLDREPAELRSLLRAHGYAWSEDASNGDLRLARNRVRHALLPALAERHDPLLARADRLAGLAQRALHRIAAACDALLDEAAPAARARCLLLPFARVQPLAPMLVRELLDRAALRLLPRGPEPAGLRTRRGELLAAIAWLRDPAARGERRIGRLGLQRSSRWLALFDGAPGADPAPVSWTATIGTIVSDASGGAELAAQVACFPPGAAVTVRTLASGDRLKDVASRLLPIERRAWPVVLVDGRVAWIPQLRRQGDVVLGAPPGHSGVVVSISGLPDLRQRAAAFTRARRRSSRRSRSASRRHGPSAA